MARNHNPDPAREAIEHAAWMTMSDPADPNFAPQPGEVETTEWGDLLETGGRVRVVTTYRAAGTPPEVEVTEWDGITHDDGSHMLATVAGATVMVSAMSADGEEVLVPLDWATAKAVADVLTQASADAFAAGHAAWIAARTDETKD